MKRHAWRGGHADPRSRKANVAAEPASLVRGRTHSGIEGDRGKTAVCISPIGVVRPRGAIRFPFLRRTEGSPKWRRRR